MKQMFKELSTPLGDSHQPPLARRVGRPHFLGYGVTNIVDCVTVWSSIFAACTTSPRPCSSSPPPNSLPLRGRHRARRPHGRRRGRGVAAADPDVVPVQAAGGPRRRASWRGGRVRYWRSRIRSGRKTCGEMRRVLLAPAWRAATPKSCVRLNRRRDSRR